MTMKAGAKIIGNSTRITTTTTYGGGVYVGDSGSFTMNGGEISGNSVSSYSYSGGGGVYVGSSGSFTMSGGEISSNSTVNNGGGVYVDISNNFSKTGGGTIYGNTGDGIANAAAANTQGHAVYYHRLSWDTSSSYDNYYRDDTLESGDDISTSQLPSTTGDTRHCQQVKGIDISKKA